ncbi:hypothetical protein [Haloferula sargassicola]|uniref:hypothetical protein n=1 Tax=Haloferula sargassicola TaxID=490096 RepID=UPI0033658F5D
MKSASIRSSGFRVAILVPAFLAAAGACLGELTDAEIAGNVARMKVEEDRFRQLADRSDLICIAEVTQGGINSTMGHAGMTIELKVEKVLKGDEFLRGKALSVYYGGLYLVGDDEDGEESIMPQAPTGRLIVFARTSEDGPRFSITDRFFGVLPYSSTIEVALRPHTDSTQDRE